MRTACHWTHFVSGSYEKSGKSLLGQGKIKYPLALFQNHCVVEVDPPQQGKVFQVFLYDPSYGKVYQATDSSLDEARASDIRQFQADAIDGFYTERQDKDPPYFEFTQINNKADNLKIDRREVIGDSRNS